MAAVRLHCCGAGWAKLPGHACWRVEKALLDMGIEYERVPGPFSRKLRTEVLEHTFQSRFPAIELLDGTWYREESKQMAARIRAGKLFADPADPAPSGYTVPDPGL